MTSSVNRSEKYRIPFFPEIERGIRFGIKRMQFGPFSMGNNPTALPLTKKAKAPPGFRENDLRRGDFHYRKHEENDFQVANQHHESDQHQNKVTEVQKFSPDSPYNDLIIYAKN